MSKRELDGYAMKQEVVRAINANKLARVALKRIMDGNLGARETAIQIAKIASALGENLEALQEIITIIDTKPPKIVPIEEPKILEMDQPKK
jgi:hypothetical protein